MTVNSICVSAEGYVHCRSRFYTVQDGLNNSRLYTFTPGINELVGGIDSENWAISYLLSMFKHRKKDFLLFGAPEVSINEKPVALNEITSLSCYMDPLDPLFSKTRPVKELVKAGLNKSGLSLTPDDLKKMFYMDDDRFERPIKGVGNEIFKAMAAIGCSFGKEFFCFPWLSHRRFEYYHSNLTTVLQTLGDLGKIVILPVEISPSKAGLIQKTKEAAQ